MENCIAVRVKDRLILSYFESEGHYPLQLAPRDSILMNHNARGNKHALNLILKIILKLLLNFFFYTKGASFPYL